jgi:hypothetical protein
MPAFSLRRFLGHCVPERSAGFKYIKGIVQPLELKGGTKLIPSTVKNWSVRLSLDRTGPLGKPSASLALLSSRTSSPTHSCHALLAPQCRYEAIRV